MNSAHADGYGWPPVFTAADAYAVVEPRLTATINQLRAITSKFEPGPERDVVMDAVHELLRLRNDLAKDFGQPSPMGPPRPELADYLDSLDELPEAKPPPPVGPISPANRTSRRPAASWSAGGDRWTA